MILQRNDMQQKLQGGGMQASALLLHVLVELLIIRCLLASAFTLPKNGFMISRGIKKFSSLGTIMPLRKREGHKGCDGVLILQDFIVAAQPSGVLFLLKYMQMPFAHVNPPFHEYNNYCQL